MKANNFLVRFSVEDLPATGNKAGAKGVGAKQPQPAAAAAGGAGLSDADADLEARLENLRRQWPPVGAFGAWRGVHLCLWRDELYRQNNQSSHDAFYCIFTSPAELAEPLCSCCPSERVSLPFRDGVFALLKGCLCPSGMVSLLKRCCMCQTNVCSSFLYICLIANDMGLCLYVYDFSVSVLRVFV